MIRLILLTDFTEAFAQYLLKGILRYSKGREPWVVCRMPPSYKQRYGIEGVLNWAKKWEADAIIAQFDIDDEVNLFVENGIVAVAQDYKSRFTTIPNITSDYHLAGRMAADFFIQKGYKNFAFFGYKDVVWSEERCEGFLNRIVESSYAGSFYEYHNEKIEDLWFYESAPLIKWLKGLPKSTALMACDDNQAIKITEACRMVGLKIPEEIAVLGVDNDTVICNLSDPPLSSLHMNIEMGGYDAAALIDGMLKNEGASYTDIYIKPLNIVNRISTDIYSTDDPYVLNAIKYIHQNLSIKLSVEDVVRQVPLSRRLLEMRFKDVTGESIYQYMLKTRIEYFAQLLLSSSEPISDIAVNIGFVDYKNLARQFRILKNCSPSEYRLRNKKKK
ncbi:DNA-binding transcriptional regulator [uncultured Bacteroides sp.]|uniref:AraC family transcriptional regulator n=1 Tax=uncultured Bacteroides sp. TaxID=162156 RepID=UPI002AAB42FF|nr:DNA-binding transcriptional regulator [uncultured Bacteroides sp.]